MTSALEARLRDAAPEDRPRAAVDLAWALALVEPERARTLTESALGADPHTRGLALRNLGYLEMTQGDLQRGIEHSDAALVLLEAVGDPSEQATAHDTLTHLYLQLGAMEEALEHAMKARALAEQSGDEVLVGWALHNLGNVYQRLENTEDSLRWYGEALPFFERAAHTVGEARTRGRLAELHLVRGELVDARVGMNAAVPLWRASGVTLGHAHALTTLARIEVADGAPAQALAVLDEAEELEVEQPHTRASIHLARGAALHAVGRLEDALDHVAKALALATEAGLRAVELEALELRGTLQLALSDPGVTETLQTQLRLSRELAREDVRARERSLRIGMEAAASRREAEVTQRILHEVLPASIVRELKLHGRVRPKHYRSATVLFTDLVGFTKISARLEPRELVAELDRIFGAFDEMSKRFGLEKLKTIGDAYMAVAGLPDPHPHHALRAVLMALHLRETIINDEGDWSIRIGLHSGPLVAGVIGHSKLAYDVWGDTVNTAARMESGGAPGRVNVSRETHAVIAPYFETEARGSLEAKGKGRLEMYFVDRLRPAYAADEKGLRPNAELMALLEIDA
ncbi:MAG: adenylate/guanylate cyclase domain-containing protein [Myxococcota bacterium]